MATNNNVNLVQFFIPLHLP